MAYWLMKSEPDAFSIDDLRAAARRTDHWDGVRNYQARNMLRDRMAKGDLALFYHSNCPQPGIAGIMEIVRAGYPDPTAFDPDSEHYDPKSDPDRPRWYMVDVRYRRKLERLIPLAELKAHRALAGLPLVQRGNRLSIMPVTAAQWKLILSLE
ncbi:MAG: EVE domain-containing protein [Gammaproteobacteria bacterium]|nr:EVE domain-containing protein [Gammaproteobacteria bacterium]